MKDVFTHLISFFKENKFKYLFGVVLLIAVDVLQLLTPLIIGQFTDDVMNGSLTTSAITKYIFFIMVLASGVALGRFGWRMTIITIAKRMEYMLRNKLFSHFEKLSQNYFNNHKTGDLMAHCTNDIGTVRQAFGQGTVLVIDSFFMTVMTVFMMVTQINMSLTLVALIPLPLIILLVSVLSKIIRSRFQTVQEAFSSLTDKVQESFSGIRIIKSFVQEDLELESFNEHNFINLRSNINLIKVQGALFPMISLIAAITIVITLMFGGNLVINGTITVGNLVAFLSYIRLLTWPMMATGFVFNLLQRGVVSLKRINTILDTKAEIIDSQFIEDIYNFEPEIEIKNLNFAYPDTSEPVLKGINMKINKGDTIAIVGRTGSGKTTLMNLLLRVYNVDNHSIYFNSHDINKIPLKTLRTSIGYVPQDNFLFSKTISDNVSFGGDHITDQTIESSTKVSMVYDEIMNFPDGFSTYLGERGVNMSGGQKQRVSIARALAKDPDIIIFDDSLSAVDTKTEETILAHLKEDLKSRTAILISHRVSTIKDADKIYVLDEGQIIEEGSHTELIENGKYYSELYEKQLLEEKITGK